MGILNFEKLPVSTLVGADSKTLKDVFEGIEREKGYRGKIRTTRCVQKILAPFYNINTRRYNALPEETNPTSPVFIIGHWRSGTTYVHNIFTQDPQFGYCTTYQTVFPHLMLWGRPFFRGAVKLFIPNERATDKMELGVDIPQEEEVALSNMTAISHYTSSRSRSVWRSIASAAYCSTALHPRSTKSSRLRCVSWCARRS